MSACNIYNSGTNNTNLCLNEFCSVFGYTNSCQSGCCTGAYCRETSACSAATWMPITISVLLIGWLIFVMVIAYKTAEAKRERLLALKDGPRSALNGSNASLPIYETQATINVKDHKAIVYSAPSESSAAQYTMPAFLEKQL